MADSNVGDRPEPKLADVRRELRDRLMASGYEVASDSHALRGELYIIGEHDLAQALFEFMPSAAEACERMYQGSWLEGMPPRFAVLPASESESAALELLQQVRVIPLFFLVRDGRAEFPELETLLTEHLRP
jgi:hypothetical protein